MSTSQLYPTRCLFSAGKRHTLFFLISLPVMREAAPGSKGSHPRACSCPAFAARPGPCTQASRPCADGINSRIELGGCSFASPCVHREGRQGGCARQSGITFGHRCTPSESISAGAGEGGQDLSAAPGRACSPCDGPVHVAEDRKAQVGNLQGPIRGEKDVLRLQGQQSSVSHLPDKRPLRYPEPNLYVPVCNPLAM